MASEDEKKKKKKRKSTGDDEGKPSKKRKRSESSAEVVEGESSGKKVNEKSVLEKTESQRPYVDPIFVPLADSKNTKKILRLVTQAAAKKNVRRGVKEVVKSLRKKESGICIIAADISPIEVIAHVPILCESADLPYVFIPSKEGLGSACFTKRPTSVVLIKDDSEYSSEYSKLAKKVKSLHVLPTA